MRILLLSGVLALAACHVRPTAPDALASTDADTTAAVWMAQTFSGGRQCAPREGYTPPDVPAMLARARVEMLGVEVERLAVCQACSCPAYAARHFVQVRAADRPALEALGFAAVDGPPEQ